MVDGCPHPARSGRHEWYLDATSTTPGAVFCRACGARDTVSTGAVEPFYGWLGSRVRELRVNRGMSQREVGERMVPPQTRASIANIENAKQRVLLHQLFQLANALGVTVLDLLPKGGASEG